METKKRSNFTCQSKSFFGIFFTCQVSACELQPFSCHDLSNDLYSETAKTVFSHLNDFVLQLGGANMTPGRLSCQREFTPVHSHGSTFVYMIPPQNVMPARVTPA